MTPEDLGEQPRTKFSNWDNDVIGDLISSAIGNRKKSSNDLVDCSIYDENDGNMHLAHPTDCNKFFKCQKGKAIGKKETTLDSIQGLNFKSGFRIKSQL